MSTLLEDVTPTARKQHTCCVCCRRIEPGEKYHRQRIIGDDGPYSWVQCAHCDAVFDWLMSNDSYAREQAYDYEGLDMLEWIRDYYERSELRKQIERQWRGVELAGIRYPIEAGVSDA